MRYYATRPPKDAPANNQTTFVKCVRHFLVKRRRALLYIAYFALGVAPAKAVHHDKWTALRQKPADLGGIRTRRRRAQAISQFAGIGYSPRVVALAGLMLRALVKCFRRRWSRPSASVWERGRSVRPSGMAALRLGTWDAIGKSKFALVYVLGWYAGRRGPLIA